MSKRKFSKKEVAISIAAAALAIATVGGAVAIHKDSSKRKMIYINLKVTCKKE